MRQGRGPSGAGLHLDLDDRCAGTEISQVRKKEESILGTAWCGCRAWRRARLVDEPNSQRDWVTDLTIEVLPTSSPRGLA